MNAGFVSEGAKARDGVIEWRVDLHCLCNHIFNLKESVCDQHTVFTNLTSLIKRRLYLLFTYSGLVTTIRAKKPPREVIPLRSPTGRVLSSVIVIKVILEPNHQNWS
jgi:hypothetical protein